MNFSLRVRDWAVDFLFPRDPKVASLEKLSPSTILRILPRAKNIENKDILALFDYSHPLTKSLIWEVKYSGNSKIALSLGAILYDTILDEISERSLEEKWGDVVVTAAPISAQRLFKRGWNQAELLLSAVEKCDSEKHFQYEPHIIDKHIHTESQIALKVRSKRLKNLKDSMRIPEPMKTRDKCIVVIDDVTTTGGTFHEIRRVLKEAGVKRVLCVAVAH